MPGLHGPDDNSKRRRKRLRQHCETSEISPAVNETEDAAPMGGVGWAFTGLSEGLAGPQSASPSLFALR